jgi:hypothetical protein
MAVNTLGHEIGAYQNLVRTFPALVVRTLFRQALDSRRRRDGKNLWRIPVERAIFPQQQ